MIVENNSKVDKEMQAAVLDRPTMAQSQRQEIAVRWFRTVDGRLEARWIPTIPANEYRPRSATESTLAISA